MIGFAKPARGSALLARRERKAARDAHERREKALVRKRDRWCRWPACEYRRAGMELPLEVAHLKHKSMGGNPANDRSDARLLLLLCQQHHRGHTSLDSGDLEVVPLDMREGTNGLCLFRARNRDGRMETVAVERTVGISEPRR